MKILAVEFSSEQRSAAVIESGHPDGPVVLGNAADAGGRRAIGLIEEALERAGCGREQIETVAVGLGPGSYTGIRGAIALAQGWQLGRHINLLGISSVECLAAQAHEQKLSGTIHVVVDAQRNEFYLARYDIDASGAREVGALRLAGFSEIEQIEQAGGALAGPGISRWFARGRNMFPEAATLGRLAAARMDFVSGEKLEPIYLRETAFKKGPPLRVMKEN